MFACSTLFPLHTLSQVHIGKRRYNIKLWKTFTDCFNCLPIAAIIDEKIFTMHGGLSPDLQSMEQIRRVMRPTDVPDTGCVSNPSLLNPSHHDFAHVRMGLQDYCVTSYGQIQTRTSPAGQRTIGVYHSLSGQMSCRVSYRSMTWI